MKLELSNITTERRQQIQMMTYLQMTCNCEIRKPRVLWFSQKSKTHGPGLKKLTSSQ